jgi:hypothetical protein
MCFRSGCHTTKASGDGFCFWFSFHLLFFSFFLCNLCMVPLKLISISRSCVVHVFFLLCQASPPNPPQAPRHRNATTFPTIIPTPSFRENKERKMITTPQWYTKSFHSHLVRQKDFSPRLRILSPIENRTPTPLTL